MAKPGSRTYEEKRDPARTNEPFGEGAQPSARTLVGAYVVHLHDATRRHYDLRVEANGVLASFAIPKGPSLDPGEKRLAIHTEDHPIEYLDFEDVIPEGQYGGGPMIVWDRGTVSYLEGPSELGVRDGKLDMVLVGRKLRGRYALVKLKNEPKAWLFFKKRDAYSIEGVLPADDVTRLDRSVLSGLTVAELEGREALGDALVAKANGLVTLAPPGLGRYCGETLPFATYTERDTLPEARGYAFEAELDGMRARVSKRGDLVSVFAADDPDKRELAGFYPEIVSAMQSLAPSRIVLEGRVVTFDAQGAPSLPRLAERAREIAAGHTHSAMLEAPVTFVVDDLLELGDAQVFRAPLSARRELLTETVRGEGLLRTSPLLPDRAELARKLAVDLGVRRIVAKRSDAPYLRESVAAPGDEDRIRLSLGPKTELARIDHGNVTTALREVRITNPQKIYFPENGYSKGQVIAYYRALAPLLLPHVRGRPVTVVRYPDGIHGKHFFQWRVPPRMPPWMRTLAFKDEEEPERPKRGFVLDDVESLLYVVNLGTIPIHVFSSKAESLSQCDYVALDFDVKLSSLRAAVTLAHTLREILEAIGLTGFPKTSGQTGLHVLVPLGRGHGFGTARALVELLGHLLVHAHPNLATMERVPERRGAKVYVDTIQTGPTRTLVAPYSLRAVPEATVSWPLEWDDVVPSLDPTHFTLTTVPGLVAARVCPLSTFESSTPDIPRAVAKLGELWARTD